MHIRHLQDSDDPGVIRDIFRESLEYTYKRAPEREQLRKILERNAPDNCECLVLIDAERPVGVARYRDASGRAELVSLYLLPKYIGRGLGSDLVYEVFERLRKAGYSEVESYCHEKNVWARMFYEKVGFTRGDPVVREIDGTAYVFFRYVKDLIM